MASRKHRPICRPPVEWSEWVEYLSFAIHGRARWRLAVVLTGMLLAGGPRTVTSWLRAAGIRRDYKQYYYFISSVGRKAEDIALRILDLLIKHLPCDELSGQKRVLLAIDDTPTKRYGPEVQAAGLHHNPTSGPDDHKWIFGHLWVTMAWVIRHPRWHTIALPFWAQLYVKRKDLPKLNEHYEWKFATKLELAAKMVRRVAPIFKDVGRSVWVVVDGAYFYRPFLREVLPLDVTVVSRLRKDAKLRTLPTAEERRRSPRRKYGTSCIHLAKRAAHRQGWQQVECTLYGGRPVVKTCKSFLATYHVVGGEMRVVIVKEPNGWEVLGCNRS